MATSFQGHVHRSFEVPSSDLLLNARRVPGLSEHTGNVTSSLMSTHHVSRKSRKGSTNLPTLMQSFSRRGSSEISPSQIIGADYETILEWIRTERMRKVPPEGSSYDRVLVWARLFVERLHSFDIAIENFEGESHMAAQQAYIHCASLLELGSENAGALLGVFGFLYRISTGLDNLLDRTELFNVSQTIKDQLVLALTDLVSLVVSVATQFHQSIDSLTLGSVSIDIYSTSSTLIESFRSRCEQVGELIWRHQLSEAGLEDQKSISVKAIKRWLSPEDPVLTNITDFVANLAQEREESTCLWMTPHLIQFLKGKQKTLAITGKPGSGKSILATVIHDHLQHPIAGVNYKSILVPINSRIPANTTPRAAAKAILLQLFAARIGNVQLYESLAEAYERCQKTIEDEAYDDILWETLGRALKSSLKGARELVLVVDGADEASCGQKALCKRLREATANVSNLRLIVLGSEKQESSSTVQITADTIFDDVVAVTRRIIQGYPMFEQLSEEQREITVSRIAGASNGSFLWAKLATKRIRDEGAPTGQALTKAVDSLIKAKYTITDLVAHRLQSKVSEDAKRILVWLATATRPLTLRELSALLSIQLEKGTILDAQVDPLNLLKPVASLVFCQNGLVRLRHGLVRAAIIEMLNQGKLPPAMKDRHMDLVRRLLLYVKVCVTEDAEVSLNPPSSQTTSKLFDQLPLLDFALRYWVGHTKTALGDTTDTDIKTAAKEIGPVMPTQSFVPLLEMTVWQQKPTPVLALLYSVQSRLYQLTANGAHPVTLQALICQALFYHKIQSVAPSEASQIFYKAAKLCHDVLGEQNVITMELVHYYLESTSTQVTQSKTEVMTRRIEMLQLLVNYYKVHHGATSAIVTSTLTQLSEHYRSIKDERKAQEIISSLQTSTTNQTPTQSHQSDESLLVQLHGRRGSQEGTTFALDDIEQDARISEFYDLASLLSKAEQYVSQGKIQAAETIYVDLWQRTSQDYRLRRSAGSELRSVRVISAYASFLKSQKRETEAASILTGFWEEYEHSMGTLDTSQELNLAKLMKSVGLSWLSLRVFKQCAQRTDKSSSVYKEIETYVQSTTRDVRQSMNTSTMGESSLQDIVFNGSTVDQSFITAAQRLVEIYMSQHRWQEATKTLKVVLQRIWPALFAPSVHDVSLPSKHTEVSIDFAARLRDCYRYRLKQAKQEDIARRLYHVFRCSRPTDDKLRGLITKDLLHLYERTSQTEKLISVHQDLLHDFSNQHGESHPAVLKELWALADLTRPRSAAVPYYQQIVRILNRDVEVCHLDAFEPLCIIVSELVAQSRYSDALEPCKTLFSTLQHPDINPKLQDQNFVKSVYERYIKCLRMVHAELYLIHDVTAQYRQACQIIFGSSALITVQAAKTLLHVCQESRQYEAEAIQLCQDLLNTQSHREEIDQTEIQATLDTIREDQYASVTAADVQSVSSEQIRRVISIRNQRLSEVRSLYGWAHEDSMLQMKDLVTLLVKRGETDDATSLLREATVKVITSETSATQLTAAAKTIASSYIAASRIQQAKQLSEELYRQIVVKDTMNTSVAKFDVTSCSRESLIFLAQLESSVREQEDSSLTVNEIHSSLCAEYMYFEEYRSEINSKTSTLQSVVTTVARLHGVLRARGRLSVASRLVDFITNYFITTQKVKIPVSPGQVRIFIGTLLEYFSEYSSRSFVRSVAIACSRRVNHLLGAKEYQSACDLAQTAFQYIRAHNGLSFSLSIVKLMFNLGLTIVGRDIQPRPDSTIRKQMLSISATIMKDTLGYCKQHNIDLTQLDLVTLNQLIGILDAQTDYHNLAWILTSLWDSRDNYAPSQQDASYTLALGRMLVITRYLLGDYTAAIRLAEDMVYNTARVHGPQHPYTAEMTVLLSQMYTSVAQGYQEQKERRELAYRYYKKAAAVHENALRVLIDPSAAASTAMDDAGSASGSEVSSPGEGDSGKYVRQHLHLLKLAVERLGNWPKDYAEYERLNSELFKEFGDYLKGVEGVDKWKPKSFGCGRAEASDDLISTKSHPAFGLDERFAIAA
ncbi:uncharacterized protein ACLA_059560 [Aspergillus clavatus NRRL 1]|uniref:Nephrocystin 3-like N-terminal domain-containing protein n=1 Tax=Aspergillus clavatus (strain ATCC 1007 / CBS 513.65 / DSM 816 / NCTC 3887 / NRRL 1 / QM 1276 / 107) TaxID=344612 RepID=A1C4E9_ASPCL|nr:uncharacterized protein ACLA_059560 [Aspergillus clavatus NRRL 1]EAW15289.1 conserved hypothetical protein [Aspergillus clavatus NRRL 1]